MMSKISESNHFNYCIKWEKYGLIIRPKPELWWMRTHAMIPTPESLENGLFKIYFSGRNDKNQSHIGWAVIDITQPQKILDFSSEPVLYPGELGCFDDNGVTPSCIVNLGEKQYLYYIGWNPGSTVRMHLFGGLAISLDGGQTFERWSRAPIIERCRTDPFLNTAPWVVRHDGAFLMYYVSGTGWVRHASGLSADRGRNHSRLSPVSMNGVACLPPGKPPRSINASNPSTGVTPNVLAM